MEENLPSEEWFVGFVEGEGNFNVSLSNTKNNPRYPFDFYPLLQFRIFLREDDLEVLQKIKKMLGMGRIYKKNLEHNRRMGFKARDQYVFYIMNSKDLLKLKEILASYKFHTKKARDREIFFKILDMKINKRHLTLEGNEEIIHLARSMNSGARDNFKVKKKTPHNLQILGSKSL